MRISNQNGFTLTELLVGISILCLLVPIACLNVTSAYKAKEVETKANLHTIQIAIERYNTDHHEYPAYLLGGDKKGWKSWHQKNDEENPDPDKPANKWVDDPLVKYDYMISYPDNPFVGPDGGIDIVRKTSFIDAPEEGDADPRFGYRGDIMGMCLDDPNFFEDADPQLPYSTIETKRTLDRGKYEHLEGFPSRHPGEGELAGLYYNFGGRYDPAERKQIITFWPGDFFYRAATDIQPGNEGLSWPYPNANFHAPVRYYFTGVWGAYPGDGIDVIRLQDVTPDDFHEQIFWRYPPPIEGKISFPCGYSGKIGEAMGLPEVFGGGDAKTGPNFPADRDPEQLAIFIYGPPDGVKDGIIYTLNSGRPRNVND